MLLAKFVPGEANSLAITCFLIFVVIALGIAWWAARRTRTTDHYYVAGGGVTGFQNGLALAGDYIYVSPTTQVDVLGHEDALFPLTNPALVSMPLAFGVGILVSLLRPEPAASARFIEAERRILLGTTATAPPPAGAPARAR